MPFKKNPGPEDYPERLQPRSGFRVAERQEEDMKNALGSDMWNHLEWLQGRRDGRSSCIPWRYILIGFIVAYLMALGFSVIVLFYNYDMSRGSIEATIEAKIDQKFTDKYRAVPIVHGKYVPVYGNEVVAED